MNFRSDNEAGVHPSILEAVSRAFASGTAPSYGTDQWTQRVERRLFLEDVEAPFHIRTNILYGVRSVRRLIVFYISIN